MFSYNKLQVNLLDNIKMTLIIYKDFIYSKSIAIKLVSFLI